MTNAYPCNAYEEIRFEVGELIPSGGTCHLVTALRWEAWRSGIIRESHVFITGPQLHLHEIEYASADDQNEADRTETACEATRALLVGYLRRFRSEHHPRQMIFGLQSTTESPFLRFHLQGVFASTLRSIPGWTTSRSLRKCLQQFANRPTGALDGRLIHPMFGPN
jgi:hypothetical protein